MGSLKVKAEAERAHISLFTAWVPYLIVAGLLVLSRTWAPLKSFLTSPNVTITYSNILGTNLSTNAQLLYLPGTIFIVAVLCTFFIQRMWNLVLFVLSILLQGHFILKNCFLSLLYAIE